MPLVVSAALVEAVAGTGAEPRGDWAWAEALAAGGWASMTRLARGDATMDAGIAATNAPAIAARLRDLQAVIDEWLALLEAADGPDEPALHARFAAAGPGSWRATPDGRPRGAGARRPAGVDRPG